MKVRVEWTLAEGWSDKPGNRLSETVEREYELPAVPQKGDYIDTGRGAEPVGVVFWSLDDGPPLLRLKNSWTGAESLDDTLASLAKHGWTQ